MSDRELAHIERVIAIDPIPGADKIEVATVLGWQCVVGKNKFKVGDLACYVEVDSIVPPIPYFLFMEPRRYRVRIIKLRKQISMGLLLSQDEFNKCIEELGNKSVNWSEGLGVTESLNIIKYLSPSEREADQVEGKPRKKHNFFTKFMTRFQWYRMLTKSRSKSFPEWLRVTDEPRCISIGTKIDTDKGLITIENICKDITNYKVLTYNEEQNIEEYKEILDKDIRRNNNDWIEIETESGKKLIVTENHRIFLPEFKCYRIVKDLMIGDELQINR